MSTVTEHVVTNATKKVGDLLKQAEDFADNLRKVDFEYIAENSDEATLVTMIEGLEIAVKQMPWVSIVGIIMAGASKREDTSHE